MSAAAVEDRVVASGLCDSDYEEVLLQFQVDHSLQLLERCSAPTLVAVLPGVQA
eukprot:m.48288 g.48288  ORF g.48288 m.48288 type:complete len:54 (+) comp15256_c0_seq8:1454-1615(+)